jgi:hypothetical protein
MRLVTHLARGYGAALIDQRAADAIVEHVRWEQLGRHLPSHPNGEKGPRLVAMGAGLLAGGRAGGHLD